jgi:Glycosyl transferase family 2
MKPLLEVLIPTYGRPESAARAILSCAYVANKDLVVSCNSNGFESKLEKFRNYSDRIRYSNFSYNRGAHLNFMELIKNLTGHYCMLLSDEDEVESSAVPKYLELLETFLDSNVRVISPYVYDPNVKRIYSSHGRINGLSLGLNEYLMMGEPISGYMSGLTFHTESLKRVFTASLSYNDPRNSYPHLDIVLKVLSNGGSAYFCSHQLVLKGNESEYGGDSHAHREHIDPKSSSSESFPKKCSTLDYNPDIYGPKARGRQFVYRQSVISTLKNANLMSKNVAILRLLFVNVNAVLKADSVVRLPFGASPIHLGIEGVTHDSLGKPIVTLYTWLFIAILKAPSFVQYFILCAISFAIRCVRASTSSILLIKSSMAKIITHLNI